MIRVLRGVLSDVAADALVRPVRSDGDAISVPGRHLEIEAGEVVERRLQQLGELPAGGAVLTPGGNLSAGFVIHVVIQSPDQPVCTDVVKLALVNAVRRAADLDLDSVAFPPVGSGAGNLEMEDAASILVAVLNDHLRTGGGPQNLTIVVENEYEEEIFLRLLGVAEGS